MQSYKYEKDHQCNIGLEMFELLQELFPICRSITGPGLRQTLEIIRGRIPIEILSVSSGYKAFDWEVPEEWFLEEAYIENEKGRRVLDFQDNNLHIVGYSVPVDKWVTLDELDQHLYSLPDQPDAIPYVTSYYSRRWGFCLTHHQRMSLRRGRYHVVIKSVLRPGVLNYGELVLPGEINKEVFLSTYICHPSLANNELSGPVVTVALVRWLMSLKDRRYTYRIVFIPETIGSIVYLSKNLELLKKNVVAGFNITCVGDERGYSYLPSRDGNVLSDKVALHVLKHVVENFKEYTWLDRGSDERQYCAPGVDLPIATIMRSKYGEYPEYHTSLDNLSLVTPQGLEGGYRVIQKAIEIIEKNICCKTAVFCEPHLGKRGLYPTLSAKGTTLNVKSMMNFISYCDGSKTMLEIADLINEPFWKLVPIAERLIREGLLTIMKIK